MFLPSHFRDDKNPQHCHPCSASLKIVILDVPTIKLSFLDATNTKIVIPEALSYPGSLPLREDHSNISIARYWEKIDSDKLICYVLLCCSQLAQHLILLISYLATLSLQNFLCRCSVLLFVL